MTKLTAWSFFLAAFANSERSRLEDTEKKSQTGTTQIQWNNGGRHEYGERRKSERHVWFGFYFLVCFMGGFGGGGVVNDGHIWVSGGRCWSHVNLIATHSPRHRRIFATKICKISA